MVDMRGATSAVTTCRMRNRSVAVAGSRCSRYHIVHERPFEYLDGASANLESRRASLLLIILPLLYLNLSGVDGNR